MRDEGTDHRGVPRRGALPALSARQRLVLHCLETEGGQLDLVELARLVSARVHGSGGGVTDATLHRTYCRLAASTLQDLEAKGLLEYREDGLVRLQPGSLP